MDAERRRPLWPRIAVVAFLLALTGVALLAGCGGDDSGGEKGQTVRFQRPTDPGPDPFVKKTDVRRAKRVEVGSGPFGGTGSDLVCDRELLIRSLVARPERLAEWARVLDVEPSARAVARYIRSLKAVTLTRDTRVTNHSFVGGAATGYQAILQAGTAVLVDDRGVPVARCRCGNPLLKPVFVEVAKCFGCPPDYRPPPPCRYFDFEDADFGRLSDDEFLARFRPADYRDTCYLPYPDPPRVRTRPARRRAPAAPPAERARTPAASFSPAVGTAADSYTLIVSGFASNRPLEVTLRRPDGRMETYTITTDGNGAGRRFFPRVDNPVLGTYTATIRDARSGDSATATTRVNPAPSEEQPPDGEELQCDPPRSQLEFEQCRDRDQGLQRTETEPGTTVRP